MATTGRLGARDRMLALIVPAVLVLVVTLAVVRYHRVDQSSWQGIGFGMFATYEYTPARTARVVATVDGERTEVGVPGDMRDRLERVLVAPGDDDAVELARMLLDRHGASALELQILGHSVRSTDDGLEISFKELRSVTVEGPA